MYSQQVAHLLAKARAHDTTLAEALQMQRQEAADYPARAAVNELYNTILDTIVSAGRNPKTTQVICRQSSNDTRDECVWRDVVECLQISGFTTRLKTPEHWKLGLRLSPEEPMEIVVDLKPVNN
jgi:hypothetical protein